MVNPESSKTCRSLVKTELHFARKILAETKLEGCEKLVRLEKVNTRRYELISVIKFVCVSAKTHLEL